MQPLPRYLLCIGCVACGNEIQLPPVNFDASMMDASSGIDGWTFSDGSTDIDASAPDAAPLDSSGFEFFVKLYASDGNPIDTFGASVATNGTIIAAGADNHDANGLDTGAVYLFAKNDETWQETDKLTASDPGEGDSFGWSLALGQEILVVGAPGNDEAGEDAGAIYIFEHQDTQWHERTKLIGSNVAAGDWFGSAVAISGTTVVVGARLHDGGKEDTGSAYVFERLNDIWQETGLLLASDGEIGDNFGHSVATNGDSVVIGAPNHQVRAGAAYVYERTGTGWGQAAKLMTVGSRSYDELAISVFMSGDLLITGATNAYGAAPASGKAAIFKHDGDQWRELTPLIATDGAPGEKFAISGAATNREIAVGAVWDDDNGPFAGAVYVYETETEAWNETKILPEDGAEDDWFGLAVAMQGNVLVVGCLYDDDNGIDSGSLYVFERMPGL